MAKPFSLIRACVLVAQIWDAHQVWIYRVPGEGLRCSSVRLEASGVQVIENDDSLSGEHVIDAVSMWRRQRLWLAPSCFSCRRPAAHIS